MADNYLEFKDAPTGNRSTKRIDPSLIGEIIRQGEKRGYDRNFTTALAGAETNFGTKGHGYTNPLSYKWKDTETPAARDIMLANSAAYKNVKAITKSMIEQGLPLKDAFRNEEYAQEKFVKPALAIQKSYDTLDEKRHFLNTSPKSKAPASPERLAWLYQGNGTIGVEAPNGYAYGKPVSKTSPNSDHAQITRRIMNRLAEGGDSLSEFVKGFK
jgi:hypothetical protein